MAILPGVTTQTPQKVSSWVVKFVGHLYDDGGEGCQGQFHWKNPQGTYRTHTDGSGLRSPTYFYFQFDISAYGKLAMTGWHYVAAQARNSAGMTRDQYIKFYVPM